MLECVGEIDRETWAPELVPTDMTTPYYTTRILVLPSLQTNCHFCWYHMVVTLSVWTNPKDIVNYTDTVMLWPNPIGDWDWGPISRVPDRILSTFLWRNVKLNQEPVILALTDVYQDISSLSWPYFSLLQRNLKTERVATASTTQAYWHSSYSPPAARCL